MIPGDIGAELARVLRSAVAAGDIPVSAATLTAAGTWRPAPARAGGAPGAYATSLPFELARRTHRAPGALAAELAAGLRELPWIAAVQVTGGGYLTVTVTAARLAGLAARIVTAGPAAAARSDALAGTRLTAPGLPDLAAEPTWERAWRSQHDGLVGRLASAAGATVLFLDSRRTPPLASTTPAGRGPVPAAVAFYGADAVRYALARTAAPRAGAIERQLSLPLDLSNPYAAVRHAHAGAASTLRWAADLGLMPLPARSGNAGPGSEPAPSALTAGAAPVPAPPSALTAGAAPVPAPPELRLLDALSWLPERVAAAARRRRPAELTAYLEHLAGAWLDCREGCPALPFAGRLAPADPSGRQAAARLELADAARVALAAGLGLLGVASPPRI